MDKNAAAPLTATMLHRALDAVFADGKAEKKRDADEAPPPAVRRDIKESVMSLFLEVAVFAEAEEVDDSELRKNLASSAAAAQTRLVDAALAEDERCRVPGVTDGLYPIEVLDGPHSNNSRGLRWGYPIFSMFRKSHDDLSPYLATSNKVFRERFKKIAPRLAGFDLKAHGLVLAGGCAAALVSYQPSSETAGSLRSQFSDIDLFLVGHGTDSKALAAISALADHLFEKWGGYLSVHRTAGCVTFVAPPADNGVSVVQVVLRRYSTLAEVIHGFDLGASAVAFDGESVYMTALGAIAMKYRANILNLKARRASYERRLIRYYQRDYALILPDFDLSKLASHMALPHLEMFGVARQEGSSCTAWLQTHGPSEWSDYAGAYTDYASETAVLRKNLDALTAAPPRTASLCASAKYRPGLDIAGVGIDLDEIVGARVLAHCVCRDNRVNLDALVRYLGSSDRAFTVLQLVETAKRSVSSPPLSMAEILGAAFARRAVELKRLPEFKIPFAFMGVEDKTALTGPFPRDVKTEKEWYGVAYRSR